MSVLIKPAARAAVCIAVLATVSCRSPEGSHDNAAAIDPMGHAAVLASVCSGCHVPGGTAISDLSQFSSARLEALMLTYKNAADGTTAMHRMARGYSEAEIRTISQFIEATAP